MTAFLADENISPQTAAYLEARGHDVYSLLRDGPRRISDSEIVALAQQQGRIILTHDLDFGHIYYFSARERIGVLVLRLQHQTVEVVNKVLTRFLRTGILNEEAMLKALIIVSENTYRVYRGSRGEF